LPFSGGFGMALVKYAGSEAGLQIQAEFEVVASLQNAPPLRNYWRVCCTLMRVQGEDPLVPTGLDQRLSANGMPATEAVSADLGQC